MYELTHSQDDDKLFYYMDRDDVERHGLIGYLKADFIINGRELYAKWVDCQKHLRTPAFKNEYDSVINSLRNDGTETPLASRRDLGAFCAFGSGKELSLRRNRYKIQTVDFSYYFRFLTYPGDYDVYCFTFDNRWLLPELAGQHSLPDICYSTLPTSGELILIKPNETGYYPSDMSTPDPAANRKIADVKNNKLGVTRAQEEAMLAGSMFGWDTPAAKPWRYDLDGSPRPYSHKEREFEKFER